MKKVEQNCEKGEHIGRFDQIRFQYPAGTQLKQPGRMLHTYSSSSEKHNYIYKTLYGVRSCFLDCIK